MSAAHHAPTLHVFNVSGSATWERLKRRFSQIFADLVLDLQGKWFGAAENRGKSQETAENRRKQFRALSPI